LSGLRESAQVGSKRWPSSVADLQVGAVLQVAPRAFVEAAPQGIQRRDVHVHGVIL
jgi:hypothetical protein